MGAWMHWCAGAWERGSMEAIILWRMAAELLFRAEQANDALAGV